MSRTVERTLAAAVAAAGIAAMIWWPIEEDMPEPDPEPVVEPEAEEPDPEEPEAEDPEPEAEEPEEPGPPVDSHGDEFTWMPAGDLVEDSGTGQTVQINYVPNMRFPMEDARAFANSQVYGHGGYLGPGGGQCDANNYAYAWRDNFCETRGYSTPMCPAGNGHQGQDIRPGTCTDMAHHAVAAEAGTVTSVGSYSVRITTDEGVRYTYLHLDKDTLLVEAGDTVERGDVLGWVSNEFGGSATTIHLHFEIKMAVDTGGDVIQNTHVPPYLALVDSYSRLLEGEEES